MIIFLYGPDAFRSGQKLAEIKAKFLTSDPAGSGLSIFDFEEKERKEKLLDVLGTPNLLAPKRLVIIKNLLAAGSENDQEAIDDYLQSNKWLEKDTDLVAVFLENSQPKKGNSLFKFLEKNGKSQQFERIIGPKLNQWVLGRLKEANAGSAISRTALERLIAYAGEDMFLLDKEIQKLANFADKRMITDSDVELLVKANVDSNIFATIDALGARNKREALKLLHRHLQNGEDPFYILSMFVYQFRNLIKVADLKENQGAGEYEISKMAKLHPFVVKKSLAQVRNFPLDKLKKIYNRLTELDTKIKTGKIEIRLALDKFIVEL